MEFQRRSVTEHLDTCQKRIFLFKCLVLLLLLLEPLALFLDAPQLVLLLEARWRV